MTVKITRTPVNFTNEEIKELEKEGYSVKGNTATLKLRVKDPVKKIFELDNNLLTIEITKEEKTIDNGFGDFFKKVIFVNEMPKCFRGEVETRRLSDQTWRVKFNLRHRCEIFSFEGIIV